MIVIHIIRRLYKSLSGDGVPWQLAMGFALGAFLGLVPIWGPDPETNLLGFNLTWFLGLGVLIVIRCSFHLAIVGYLVFAGLGKLFLDQQAFALGQHLLEDSLPQDLIVTLFQSSFLSYLQWHTYWVMGAMTLGLALSLLTFVATLFAIRTWREPLQRKLDESRTLRTLRKIWLFRFLRWLFIGGSRVV